MALCVAVACCLPAYADRAPIYLVVGKSSSDVELAWSGGEAPFGVFRAARPDKALRSANMIAVTDLTTYADPMDGSTVALSFYLVDEPLRCIGDLECADDVVCTLDVCDQEVGLCSHDPVDCDDSDVCTTDTCDPFVGCTHEPVVCDDGNACTEDSSCDDLLGCVFTPVICDDLDACTIDACAQETGCQFVPINCSDGDACTNDFCVGGSCEHDALDCDDSDACTVDGCDPSSGCLNDPIDCADDDACTSDFCMDGSCEHEIVDCDDADGCTVDSCDSSTGCRHDPIDCSDGDACNGDFCAGGSCYHGPSTCNDFDACTVDGCDMVTGCWHEALDCSDGDPCTLDLCGAVTGCRYGVEPSVGLGTAAELVGSSSSQYPFFQYVRAFNENAPIQVAIDPTRFPAIVDRTCDIYVVEARGGGWCSDANLTDIRGAPDTRTFGGGSVHGNTFPLVAPYQLSADAGTGVGVGYDVVLDCDRDGVLDSDDFVDGLSGEAGFYVVHDLTEPGSLLTNSFDDLGPDPNWCEFFPVPTGTDDMRVYYPAVLDDPEFTGSFPLVVISHGNGHCFDWYDFLGHHLTSYGYIVMAHDNATKPGIFSASTTTLEFTDKIIAEQETLGSGVLEGHIDSHRITWIGHSRGGEGVTRAYDRLATEGYVPPSGTFTLDDIVLVSAIAPTDILGPQDSHPHGVPFHMLYGAADGDVCSCPQQTSSQSFNLYERSGGYRQSTYIHGADHNDFNCCGPNDFAGPEETEIGRPEAQRIQKATYVALLKRYVEGNMPARDFLSRQYESLRPIGVAGEVSVDNEYREGPAGRGVVVDDFQTEPDPAVSSSGTFVSFDVRNLVEGRLIDGDSSYGWIPSDPMNGMIRGRGDDTGRGVVFDFGGGAAFWYEVEIPLGDRDMRAFRFLSLRACQRTRHPETTAVLEDLTFTVTLLDTNGGSSSINIGAYGGGVEEPYQRTGFGAGVGWQNEFETIRIRLTDFLANGSELKFDDVRSIRLEFGASFGSPEGALGLDDIELTLE